MATDVSSSVIANTSYVSGTEVKKIWKMGKLVVFSLCFSLSTVPTDDKQELFSGLPPVDVPSGGYIMFTGMIAGTPNAAMRYTINSGGLFRNWYNPASSFTEGKLASNSVTTSKIADASVTSDKIDWATVERNCVTYGDRFTSEQSGVSIPLHSVNYTSKTGKVVIIAYAYAKTSRYTSLVRIRVDGSLKTSNATNSQTEYRLCTPMWCGDIGTSPVTISTEVVAQDSGTTAYTPGYQGYGLTIFDI